MISRPIFFIIGWIAYFFCQGFVWTGIIHADGAAWEARSGDEALSGHVRFRYQAKHAPDESNTSHYLFQSLDASYLPLTNDSGLVVSGDLYENVGGQDQRPESVWTTYGDVHGFIHESYVQLNDIISTLDAKAGRQYVSHELPVHLDGVHTQYRFPGGRGAAYLFGGYAADPYGDTPWDSSRQVGIGAHYRIADRTRTGIEYLGTREEAPDTADETFHQAALSLAHHFDKSRAGLSLTSFDSDVASFKLSASFLESMGIDSEISLSYFHQLTEIQRMPTSQSPFISLLGPVKPYQQISIYADKGFSEHSFHVSTGLDVRNLLKNENESEYNHSYMHAYIAFDRTDLWSQNLRLTVQADYWRNMDAGTDGKNLWTGGGEMEYGFTPKTAFALGSYYSLFTYDYYTDLDEKTDVYSIFSRIRHRIGKSLQIKGEYELDLYDQQEHRLNLTADVPF
ncbi:MAG: hypothetical protein ABIK15_01645 [Pseudomonadota bacterium]